MPSGSDLNFCRELTQNSEAESKCHPPILLWKDGEHFAARPRLKRSLTVQDLVLGCYQIFPALIRCALEVLFVID